MVLEMASFDVVFCVRKRVPPKGRIQILMLKQRQLHLLQRYYNSNSMQSQIFNKRHQTVKILKTKLAQLEKTNGELTRIKNSKYKQFVNQLNKLTSVNFPLVEQSLESLLGDYTQCLDNKQSSKLTLKQLTTYLKSEQQLSMTIADHLLSLEDEESNKYHDLIHSNNYNLTLAKLNLQRLKDQIQFIENNIMSGKTFIYQPKIEASTVSVEDIKKQLIQLERVIRLNPHCSPQVPKQLQKVVKAQYIRQKQIYDKISKQIKLIAQQISKFKDLKIQQLTIKQEQPIVHSKTKRKKEEIVQFVEFEINLIDQIKGYRNSEIQQMNEQIQMIRSALVTKQLQKR